MRKDAIAEAVAAHYEPLFAEEAKRWSMLDGYYIPTRYPDGLPDGIPAQVYTQGAARDAVAFAQEAVAWVRELLDQMAANQGPDEG
jgi:HEPN domain-containing protein